MIFAGSKLKEVTWGSYRLCNRSKAFPVIIIASIGSILYLTWFLPGFSVKNGLERLLPAAPASEEVQAHWNNDPRRLIVFGDSWSDDGQYPIDPPPKDQIPRREEARGRVWTEWLCSAISCTHHDNFARSLPNLWDSGYSGPVIDSDLLNETMQETASSNSTISSSLQLGQSIADLKTQVQQWLKFEKQQYATSRVSEIERNGTVFIIWVSLWDIWYYSEKEHADAEYAVSKVVDVLFEQLDVIAESWPTEMKVIMPEAIDITFLPGWHSTRAGNRTSFQHVDVQRNAIGLVEQWNRALDLRATRWQGGSMYIYNTNEWLLDQIREKQLFGSHLSDANGMGTSQSPWSNVRSGCKGTSKGESGSSGEVQCSDPKTHLFWDDMHLGPEAMKLIGEGVAHDIAGPDHGSSWFAHDIETTHEDKETSRPLDTPAATFPLPTSSDSMKDPYASATTTGFLKSSDDTLTISPNKS